MISCNQALGTERPVPGKPPKWIVLRRSSQAVKDLEQTSKAGLVVVALLEVKNPLAVTSGTAPGIASVPLEGYWHSSPRYCH